MPNTDPLDAIDLSQMTLGDIKKMDNPVLRESIQRMLESREATQPQHTSHGMHTSHLSSDGGGGGGGGEEGRPIEKEA